MKIAARHYCSLRDKTGHVSFHTTRNGKPRSKRCTYCAGALVVETGLWGAFVWTGDRNYPLDAALRIFVSEGAAQRFADQRNCDTADTVVRWIPVDAAASTP